MFQFPWFPLPALCVQAGVVRHDPYQVVLFGNPRINACLAASRGLSQPATSFVGFQRLGIHRVPFATCRDDARARYGVLKVRAPIRTARLRGLVDLPRRGGSLPRGSQRIWRSSNPTGVARPPLKRRFRDLQSCTVCPTR
jgi:hypothetical protein